MNRVFSNIVFLIVLNLLVKPFWIFGIELTVQNRLGAEAYGNYFALFNFVILFQILLDLGINSFNNRQISQKSELLPSYFSSIVVLKLLMALAYGVIVLIVASALGYDAYQIKLLGILMIGQVALSFLLYFRSNLGALQLFKRDGLLSIGDKLIMIAVMGALLWTQFGVGKVSIVSFAGIQTIAFVVMALMGVLLVLREIKKDGRSLETPNASQMLSILKQSYPFALLILLMAVYNRIDGVMIERMLVNGQEEAGIYAAGYRLLDAINQIGLLSATILYPVYSKMIAEGKAVNVPAVRAGKIVAICTFILCISCFLYQSEIMNWLYTDATPYYSEIFAYLIWSFVGISCTYVFGTLLTSGGHLKELNIIALSGVLLNLVLNYFLISSMNAKGAALATLITQSLVALSFLVLSSRYYKISLRLQTLLKGILFIALTTAFVYYMKDLNFGWWQLRFVASGILALAAGVVLFGKDLFVTLND